MRGARVGRDPRVHVSFFVRQFVFQLSGQVAGVLRLDKAQRFEIAELKVPREAVERQAIGLVEARAVSAADFEPGPVLGKRRLDRLVQIAFDRCWCAIVVIVVEALLIADALDRLAIGDHDIAMALEHHDLVLIVGAGEATHVELRHIMMLLCLIRGHGQSSFSMRYLW